jgi:hypothetical protein
LQVYGLVTDDRLGVGGIKLAKSHSSEAVTLPSPQRPMYGIAVARSQYTSQALLQRALAPIQSQRSKPVAPSGALLSHC